MATLLTAVRGIGPAAAKNLADHGIRSVEELASVSVARLCEVPGYSTILSQRIIADARALLAQGGQADIEDYNDSAGGKALAGNKAEPAGKARGNGGAARKGKEKQKDMAKNKDGAKKSVNRTGKTNKQEAVMSKKSSKKVKSLKKEIKSRKAKISRQDKKIKRLKKELKKTS
jgi:hypothetical protein